MTKKIDKSDSNRRNTQKKNVIFCKMGILMMICKKSFLKHENINDNFYVQRKIQGDSRN